MSFIDLFADVWDIFVFLFSYFVFWAPFVLGVIAWQLWRRYIQKKWINKINFILLEIQLPRDIRRTPLAMEVMLNALHQTSKGTWWTQLTQGQVMDWFSLELVSLGGNIKFFIRTPDIYKNIIEAAIYSQYPSAEINETPDYTRYLDYTGPGSEWDLWGSEFSLSKPDAYPIKTYVDYGLHREGLKGEEIVDPLTSILEYLGTLNPGEQLWMQIVVRATSKRFYRKGSRRKEDWRVEGEKLVEKIMEKYTDENGKKAAFTSLSKGDQQLIEAIQRNTSKLGFDTGIRIIYWTREHFRVTNVKAILGMLRPFNTKDMNGFDPAWLTGFDYPWQDFKHIRQNARKKRMFRMYKERAWFEKPYQKKPMILNSEELATIFHFPGQVAETPTFGRIESRKGEPPTNLPT